jgi:hypothetical protein
MAAEVDDSGRWPRLSNDADDPSEIPDPGDHDFDEDSEYSRFPTMFEGLTPRFGFDPMVRARCTANSTWSHLRAVVTMIAWNCGVVCVVALAIISVGAPKLRSVSSIF